MSELTLSKDDVCKGLYLIERLLKEIEGEDSPIQFEAHRACLEYAISVLKEG